MADQPETIPYWILGKLFQMLIVIAMVAICALPVLIVFTFVHFILKFW
jgi:hypothetical protein